MDLWDQTGRIVIVTGASSGIGAATARRLHADGAVPVLAARRADRLERLSEELDGALAVPTDVTDRAAVARLVDATLQRHGRVDGLVNNAGVTLHQPLDRLDLDEFARVFDRNVVSAVAVTQAVLPAMRAAGSGRIVTISSGTTRMAVPGVGPYAATKAALNMVSAVFRAELEPDGIVVSLLLPSITATEFDDVRHEAGAEVLPGVVAHSPEYVAGFVLRVLRSGEDTVDIPLGPEQPELTNAPAGGERAHGVGARSAQWNSGVAVQIDGHRDSSV